MLRGFATLAAGIAALLGAAGAADAADVTYPDGRREKIAPDTEVTGPAVITSDSGKGTIRLRSGAVLRYLFRETEGERTLPSGAVESRTVETMFLKHGIADADLDFDTRLATPAFWLLAKDRGERVRATICSIDKTSSHARVDEGSGMARLYVGTVGENSMEANLLPGQGLKLVREKEGALRFRTDADNAWTPGPARILYPVADGRLCDVYVPKAAEGAIELLPGEEPRALRVESSPWSWYEAPCHVRVTSKDGKASEASLRSGRWVRSTVDSLVSGDLDPPIRGNSSSVAREDSNRGQRRGTRFLDGRLEVVDLRVDLVGEKPSITFVLERMAGDSPEPLPKDLVWSLEFGEPGHMWHMGKKYPVTGNLDKPGDRVTLTTDLGGPRPEKAGLWPDLQVRVRE